MKVSARSISVVQTKYGNPLFKGEDALMSFKRDVLTDETRQMVLAAQLQEKEKQHLYSSSYRKQWGRSLHLTAATTSMADKATGNNEEHIPAFCRYNFSLEYRSAP